MRCKKHLTDLSSSVGVCASCLRERLFTLIAAQEQANLHHHHHSQQQQQRQQLPFPRSVSPYVSRSSTTTNDHPLFFNTPQLNPPNKHHHHHRRRNTTFSLLSKLFRGSRPPRNNPEPVPRRSCADDAPPSSSAPSWISAVFRGGRRKNQSRLFSMDESTQRRCRGMSPAMYSEDEECVDVTTTSGYTSEQQTPARRRHHQRNVTTTGIAFCLSPLVRASPSRNWKTATMDVGVSGEMRGPPPSLSYAKTFCANRSRKLADIGRFNPNHHLS